MIEAVSRQFGPSIWSKAIIGLTHGDMRSPPPGTDFGENVNCVLSSFTVIVVFGQLGPLSLLLAILTVHNLI